jgi:hypothetical protein
MDDFENEYSPAEITRARLAPRPMVVAPPIHIRVRPTARPPERLRPVLVQLLLVAAELALELRAHLVRLLLQHMAPPGALLRVGPGDELEVALVAVAVAALAVLVVPLRGAGRGRGGDDGAALGLVGLPVRGLALAACVDALEQR